MISLSDMPLPISDNYSSPKDKIPFHGVHLMFYVNYKNQDNSNAIPV
jgi:hypothetical protein